MSSVTSSENLYVLHETRTVRIRLHYPKNLDQLVLRTELDWDKDIRPSSIDQNGLFAEFVFETTKPFVYLKPCLKTPSGLLWSKGPNSLVVATRDDIRDGYPTFYTSED